MFSKRRLVFVMSLTCMFTFAAPPDTQGQRTHVEVSNPNPVLDVIENLIAKHRWAIHFEDWGEVPDEKLKEIFGTNGQRWLVREPSTLSLDIPSPETLPKNQRGQVMEQIIESHRSSSPTVLLGSSYDGGALQVFPVAVRLGDGSLRQVTPLLDTRVSIPLGRYSLFELLHRVIGQVEEKRSVSIVMATLPGFGFLKEPLTEQADEEPARDVLLRIFRDINGVRMARQDDYAVPVWSLRYEPTGKRFYMNVGIAERVPFSEMNKPSQEPRKHETPRTKLKSPTGLLDPTTATKQ